QALINLIMNGIQAMPQGGELTLTGRASAGAQEAGLEVSDTGSGILPQILPRIFDPFFTTKAEGQGTGLGLSITQSIIERHRGHIQVESQPDRGTTFRLVLPLTSGRG
ncbi:MAG: histidine kinase, partial [Deltaproteobacteria bacterium]|nr:histidine kinase [Deltaproteobacteria bacterium]